MERGSHYLFIPKFYATLDGVHDVDVSMGKVWRGQALRIA